MPHNVRVAISLPEPVVEAVDDLAQERGETRARFISAVLERVARAKRDRDISAAIDALFGDPEIRAEQKKTADLFLRASRWPKEIW